MKILVFAIIASMAIAVIVSISLFTLHENRSPCTFCPMIPSQPSANTSSIQNAFTETNQTSTSISNIIIPAGAEDPDSGKNYEPRYLVVVLGVNNTVKWTNESPSAAHSIVADNHDDPLFWNATRSANSVLLYPGKSFNFTFTKTGEFQYDTDPHPWMYGWVLVLPQSAKNVTTTVSLNTSSDIPGPCAVFGVPCPNNPSNPNSYNFTAQKFGQDIYIEEMTINGVDNYAVIKPNKDCYYPQGYGNTCTNPDDLAILQMVGVNASIPQEYVAPKTVLPTNNATSENLVSNNEQTGMIPSCVTNIQNPYAVAGAPGSPLCPPSNFTVSTQIINSTGFYGVYTYDKFPSAQNFVLEPGHNGTITYTISTGTIHNLVNIPEYPNKVNIPNYVTFMHDAGMQNHPGVNVTAMPLAQIVGSNESVSVSFMFSASKSALPGSYWVTLPPGICEGGQMLVLTIANCTK